MNRSYKNCVSSTMRQLFGALSISFVCLGSLHAQVVTDEVDKSFNLGPFSTTGTRFASANIIDSDTHIIATGNFNQIDGTDVSHVAKLNLDGSVDGSFNANITLENSVQDGVKNSVVLSDGSVVIHGQFTHVDGVPRPGIAMLNSDGTLKASFQPPSFNFSFAPSSTSIDDVAAQSDGKIIVAGQFDTVGSSDYNNLVRLNVDGSIDNTFQNAGFVFSINAIDLQSDEKIVLGFRDGLRRINANGTLDGSFTVTTNFPVLAIAIDTSDDDIFFAGVFTTVNSESRLRLAKVDNSGALASGFKPEANQVVSNLRLLANGDVLAAGSFSQVDSTFTGGFARLNPDTGALDTDFITGFPQVFGSAEFSNGNIVAVGSLAPSTSDFARMQIVSPAAQLDQNFVLGPTQTQTGLISITKIVDLGESLLVGGSFSQVDGVDVRGFIKISPDGELDQSYQPQATYGGDAVVQGDKIIVGGGPDVVARIDFQGNVDSTFTPDLPSGFLVRRIEQLNSGELIFAGSGVEKRSSDGINSNGFSVPVSGLVSDLAVQQDGKILLVGTFTQIAGVDRQRIARLNADGTLDDSFNPGLTSSGASPFGNRVVVRPDGKILVGGVFEQVAGIDRSGLVLLNPDASVDPDFNPTIARPLINDMVLLNNNSVLVTGGFDVVNGETRRALALINSDGTLDLDFELPLNGPFENTFQTGQELLLTGDKRLYIGGSFFSLGEFSNTKGIARLIVEQNQMCWVLKTQSGIVFPACL